MSITKQQAEDLGNRFRYHPPTGGKAAKHEAVREACLKAAIELTNLCPESRELSMAISHLDQAMMAGNAAIARYEEKIT